MDLVKARERARMAQEEAEKKAAEEKKRSAGQRSTSAKKTAKKKKAARKKVPAATAKAPKSRKPPQPMRPPVAEDEVFTDEAFGEDLPPQPAGETACEEVILAGGMENLEAGERPLQRKKIGGEPAADEDLSWEVSLDEIRGGAAEPSAVEKNTRTGRGPVSEENVVAPKPRTIEEPMVPDRLIGKERAPIAARAPESGEDWKVEEPAAPVRPAPPKTIEMEWEEDGEAGPKPWSLDDLAGGDDFFALVTEDLYAREFGRAEEEDLGSTLELLSFKLASEIYGVALTSIRQIIKMTPITMVPRAPEYVLGIISLRGSIIPIFDLRRRLNLDSALTTRRTRIIVVAEGAFTVGLIVDEVEQVVRIPETSLEPPPPMLAGIEAGYIKGIGRFAKKMVLVLALDKILVPVAPAQ